MKYVFSVFATVLLIPTFASANCEIVPSVKKLYTITDIQLVRNNIFDEKSEKFTRMHGFANKFHVVSLPKTVLRDFPLKHGEQATLEQIEEAERILRKKPYFREAQIETLIDKASACDEIRLFINTWDNWSLQPGLSFGQSGGKSKSSISIKDDNLLGLGIGTELKYFTQDTRTGYVIGLKAPFHNPTHSDIALRWSNNSDGYDRRLSISNPFYSYADNWYFEANYIDSLADELVYRNDVVDNEFRQDRRSYGLTTGYQLFDSPRHTFRALAGFSDRSIANTAITGTNFLPQDRIYTVPWLGFEFLQKDFSETHNINFVNRTEDLYLGWYSKASAGKNLASQSIVRDATILNFELSNTKLFNNAHIWKNTLAVRNESLNGFEDFLSFNIGSDLFYRYNNKWAFHTSVEFDQFNNPFGDQPLTLGESIIGGVRGYPLQYHHGDKRSIFSMEARYYAKHNIFDLVDVGYASFFDIGKTWGDDDLNLGSQTLASVGMGARLFSSRSSGNNVVHIDLAHPLSNDPSNNLKGLSLGVKVKHGF